MGRYEVRPLTREDFSALMQLEDDIFGSLGESTLGAYYVRLCCDFYAETCFLALDDGRPVGYVLCFVKGREAYCTTLGIMPAYQGTRIVHKLLRALIAALLPIAESVWFTVKEDNLAARKLHASLGAKPAGRRHDFYGPGDDRLVSVIDRAAFEQLRARYQRIGLVENDSATAGATAGAIASAAASSAALAASAAASSAAGVA
jgi:ribosomal protein S18 acetylase RimI-like enzyme